MFTIHREEITWGGRKLTLETGKIARQADGAVMIQYGETIVLATVVGARKVNPEVDFFPLTVHYQEKYYASGKIPGGFFKREGRPTERETLVSRLIDRPIRPLFHPDFKNETQVLCTVLSYDPECDPDVISIIGASAALTLSGLPFLGPVGAAKVGYKNGNFLLNPSLKDVAESELELVVAGTSEGVLMVESEANQLSEETMLQAVTYGHEHFQPVIDAIIRLAEKAAKEPWDILEPVSQEKEIAVLLREFHEKEFRDAYAMTVKQDRSRRLNELRTTITQALAEKEFSEPIIAKKIKELESEVVRHDILKTGKRIDGRDTKTIRPIMTEVGVLPKPHGSALFTRGETQALVVTTLGTGRDEQFVDGLEAETKKERFMLHYNFPPFSVGEVGRMGSTGRREIGHGKLAWRALRPLIPSDKSFPYTLRIVSEITESNGSSSMATVCGASMSLMDAGVPIEAPIAGIAMGLIQEGDQYAVLSDILGDEDHLGDMDFKVAGTQKGITSLQMDLKVTSVTPEIMKIALAQAKEGRIHILGEMAKAIAASHKELKPTAPRIVRVSVPSDKVGELIGPGGAMIRSICESTGVTIDINDKEGYALVGAVNKEASDKACAIIQGIVAEPEVGTIYEGPVVGIKEFGAFVNFLGNKDGLVHISELAETRVAKVEDVVKLGDIVKVKCLGFDPKGKVKLTMKGLNQPKTDDIVTL